MICTVRHLHSCTKPCYARAPNQMRPEHVPKNTPFSWHLPHLRYQDSVWIICVSHKLATAFAFSARQLKPFKAAGCAFQLQHQRENHDDFRKQASCDCVTPFLEINCFVENVSKFHRRGIKLSFKLLLFANTTLQECFNIYKVCTGLNQEPAEHAEPFVTEHRCWGR